MIISGLFRNKRKDELEKYNRILEYAKLIMKTGRVTTNHPILDAIRLIGRPLQTQLLTQILYYDQDDARINPERTSDDFIFKRYEKITNDERVFADVIIKKKVNKKIVLGRDLVLPWPWSRSRSVDCVINIGSDKPWGEWKQDDYNHRLELWLPIGVSWVLGGNHSIASGVIKAVGEVEISEAYDISAVYDYVRCDGVNYLRNDGSIISPVKNIEFAAIFEIGRMMCEKSISF